MMEVACAFVVGAMLGRMLYRETVYGERPGVVSLIILVAAVTIGLASVQEPKILNALARIVFVASCAVGSWVAIAAGIKFAKDDRIFVALMFAAQLACWGVVLSVLAMTI